MRLRVLIEFAALALQPALEDLFEAGLKRIFHLSLRRSLNDDWLCEALEQVHRVAVGLDVVIIFTAQHVELDAVATEILNQKRVSIVEGHLQAAHADVQQVFGKFEQELVVFLHEILAARHVFIDDANERPGLFRRNHVLGDAVSVNTLAFELLEFFLAVFAFIWRQKFV